VVRPAQSDSTVGDVSLPRVSKAGTDAIVARFDGANMPVFAQRYGSKENTGSAALVPKGVAAAGAGAAIVTGSVTGAVDFGQGKVGPTASTGNSAIFLARIQAD